MFKIQTRNRISPVGLNLFNRTHFEAAGELPSPDALLLRSAKVEPESISPSVLAIARAGAGVNNIPVSHCTEKGIVVFNTPGANANSVKELVIAAMLLLARKIHQGINWTTSREKTEDLAKQVEQNKSAFAGGEIAGKKLGVIGLGAIGVLVANAAKNLGMEVYGHDPFISVQAAWGLLRDIHKCDSLDALMADCEYISLHVPLTDDTRGLVNPALLKRAKDGLRILNFSRAPLVDTQAVKDALQTGKVAGYATDFPTPELAGVDGVLPIPHLGASTAEAEDNCAVMAVNQLKDFLEHGNITNSVNFPSCSLEPNGGARLLVANRNIPNMLSQILAALADAGLNIQDMVNRHRGEIAYNIIDLDTSRISPEAMARIASIEGVIMTRQIPKSPAS